MCVFLYLFIYVLTYCCILMCIIYMCISFIESMVKSRILFTTHEITVGLENWSISRSKLRNHCNYTQGHPANHHLRGTEGSSQLGVMVKKCEKIKRSKNMKLQNPPTIEDIILLNPSMVTSEITTTGHCGN